MDSHRGQWQTNGNRSAEVDTPTQEWSATGPLVVESFGLTDRGQVREKNEDHFLIAVLSKALQIKQASLPQPRVCYGQERAYLFLVADGMGGHRGGEQASALAVDSVEAFVLNSLQWFLQLKEPDGGNVLAEFQAALRQTDARICREAVGRPELEGMGTTVTMAYSLGRELLVAHAGDSRCYLFRNGELHQLTHDHTLVQEMVNRGVLAADEAEQHKWRHVITNVLGGNELGVQPEVRKVHLEPGDRVLLCSDGLTDMVPDEMIRTILQTEPEPRRACEHLVDEANGRGGEDNMTVVLARYDMADEPLSAA